MNTAAATRLASLAAGEPFGRHGERVALRVVNDNQRIRLVSNNKFTSQTGGSLPFTPSYDATGNMTTINNGITLVYDGRNRVASSTGSGITTNYWVNGLGQRVRKTWNGSPSPSHVLFTFAPDGKHIGSYTLTGGLTEETIFLGDTPIAVVTGAGTFNLYADHINAIRQVTNQTNQTRWSWEQTNAFGSTLPNQNPTGLGTFNYRRGFPGQFYDAELLTWNNGFRTYHAGLGRYLQPDPIGLAGGDPSMFGYVGQMPSMAVDPNGLFSAAPVLIEGGIAATEGILAAYRWMRNLQMLDRLVAMMSDADRKAYALGLAATAKSVAEYCPKCKEMMPRSVAKTLAHNWAGIPENAVDFQDGFASIPWKNNFNFPDGLSRDSAVWADFSALYNEKVWKWHSAGRDRGSVEEHPFGHPDEPGGLNHDCPHFLAISPAGVKQEFPYQPGSP